MNFVDVEDYQNKKPFIEKRLSYLPRLDVPDFQKYKDARHEQMNTQNLPEVKVYSDYKKWLLIGGGVLAVYWLFFRKKRG